MKSKTLSTERIMGIAIGLVYLWFGVLKFFPELSPAEKLAQETISSLTFHTIPGNVSIILLAIWETVVGVLLIFDKWRKPAILLALLHMVCTFTPLFLFPRESFTALPYGFTLVGQYIFKNIVFIVALVMLWKNSPQERFFSYSTKDN